MVVVGWEDVDERATIAEAQAGAAGLGAMHCRIGRRFARSESRQQAGAYLKGLLGPAERKNGWQLAEAAGDRTPDRMQRLLSTADWDADLVRDDLQAYVVEYLAEPDGVLVVDETGFLKKGTKSVGVQRQYSGTAGRIENCQSGVFLAYASPQGHTFLDRELYLPKEWAGDAARRREAGVPEEVTFQTKPELARRLLERARGVGVPARWVTADEVFGGDRRLRAWLDEQGIAHVLAVKRTEPLWTMTAQGPAQVATETITGQASAGDWRCLSAGDGAKGPRLYDWLRVPIRPLGGPDQGDWLLVRRSLSDPADLAYYVCFGPRETTLEGLAGVAWKRWAIEECLERAKGEVGLDQYEVRRWTGWYRHITLALFAHAYLTVMSRDAARNEVRKKGRWTPLGGRWPTTAAA